ncbi:unnamed protein product [Musa hybrid cultivar]
MGPRYFQPRSAVSYHTDVSTRARYRYSTVYRAVHRCTERYTQLQCRYPRTAGLSDRYVPPVPGGTVRYGRPCFQLLFVALTCTCWCFDMVLIKIWIVFICCVQGNGDGHLVLHGHVTIDF